MYLRFLELVHESLYITMTPRCHSIQLLNQWSMKYENPQKSIFKAAVPVYFHFMPLYTSTLLHFRGKRVPFTPLHSSGSHGCITYTGQDTQTERHTEGEAKLSSSGVGSKTEPELQFLVQTSYRKPLTVL